MPSREQIACDILGIPSLDGGCYAPCPGAHRHTHQAGARDFRVLLEGAPTGYCFHASCSAEVEAFNKELRRRIWAAEHAGNVSQRGTPRADYGRTAPEPQAQPLPKRPAYDLAVLQRTVRPVHQDITPDWLAARSPLPVRRGMQGIGADFLDHLYQPGEKILIFTKFKSQGQFGYHVGDGGWRLGAQPGIKPVRSDLPLGGEEGVWFLSNPVTGQWLPNTYGITRGAEPRMGRRHGACITAWRYLVIESDDAPIDLWLKFLVLLPLPIVAIYTSGGKSVHALVRLDAPTKQQWDQIRDQIGRYLAFQAGADPAAATAVRLTRLPGCLRGDRLQELLYLNPAAAAGTKILDPKPVTRSVGP